MPILLNGATAFLIWDDQRFGGMYAAFGHQFVGKNEGISSANLDGRASYSDTQG